jgi:hypothetical protein
MDVAITNNPVIRETEKAVLIEAPLPRGAVWKDGCHSRELWVPKSLITITPNAPFVDEKTVPFWFANQNGLVS